MLFCAVWRHHTPLLWLSPPADCMSPHQEKTAYKESATPNKQNKIVKTLFDTKYETLARVENHYAIQPYITHIYGMNQTVSDQTRKSRLSSKSNRAAFFKKTRLTTEEAKNCQSTWPLTTHMISPPNCVCFNPLPPT